MPGDPSLKHTTEYAVLIVSKALTVCWCVGRAILAPSRIGHNAFPRKLL